MSQKSRDNSCALCLLTYCFVAVTISGCRATSTDGEIEVAQDSRMYYVNAQRGDDSNPGTDRNRPWRSIARVNTMDFAPGDQVLFAGGQTFAGTLRFEHEDSGTRERPVRIGSFGGGRATIYGGTGAGLQLIECAYVTVSELAFVGCGRKNDNDGNGMELDRTEHVELDSLDVSGFRLSGVVVLGGRNIRITRVDAHDNGFAGISTSRDADGARTKDLYIGHCIARNNPGDPQNLTNHSGNGIVVGGLDRGLLEYCLAFDNGWDMPRQGNGPVGIWGWDCDRLTIQHCISHDNKTAPGAFDGGGFDLDGGATRSILQYNLSYHNHGCGYLLCQYPGARPWKDNVCRYNISINDGLTNHFSGIYFWAGDQGISDAQVYNNVVVNDRYVICSTHDIEGLVFRNNILQAGQAAVVGPLRRAIFENNLYHISSERGVVFQNGDQTFQGLADWARATGKEMLDGRLIGFAGDPKLVLPENLSELPTDPQQLQAMPFFRLQPGSPCIGSGMVVADNGAQDFFGNPVPASSRPSLGVHEPTR
ncbi:MAG TPA: right-handed parallel beta-helix repeat-containing protein [Sedimentisphaerales bacterium]|nr:right-handed parallel beta-helix repeat-containing protein [Sedimentisphaerales bacterium]HRS10422.1 right-handed parallel beta-helix repeat-containing protein [Sedimentisphaerales bacterium]HRV47127.1 right-handed parallel beta-helix repeat-containing protein [Sedimentisphaerales bacterium]